jgi:hypothetical protein
VAADGTSAAVSHPHSLRTVAPALRKSIRARVVGRFHTALARNASMSGFLSRGALPFPRYRYPFRNASNPASSAARADPAAFALSGPCPSSKHGTRYRFILEMRLKAWRMSPLSRAVVVDH